MSEKKYVTENIRPDYREEYLRNSVFIAYAVLYIIWFFNLLTLSVPDVTPGCFSIFWLWAYLTLLQDVFQCIDFERTWRYSRMFPIFWLWSYLTLLQDVFQSFDFERTWRYSRIFFILLTLSAPDVTPWCFSIFWLWAYLTLLQDVFSIFWLRAYLTLLQDVFQSFDFENISQSLPVESDYAKSANCRRYIL